MLEVFLLFFSPSFSGFFWVFLEVFPVVSDIFGVLTFLGFISGFPSRIIFGFFVKFFFGRIFGFLGVFLFFWLLFNFLISG